MLGFFDGGPYGEADSTPSERRLLPWLLVLVLAGLGVLCLVLGWRAPADKPDEAAALINAGLALLAAATAIGILTHLIGRFLDR